MAEYRCQQCDEVFTRNEDDEPVITDPLFDERNRNRLCNSCQRFLHYQAPYSPTSRGGVFKLNLLENAIDYLNASLAAFILARTRSDAKQYKYAITNIVISIELFMKEMLKREHPLLVIADLDRTNPKDPQPKTVSWAAAIKRLTLIHGDSFTDLDGGRLHLAQTLRNRMLHYDVDLSIEQTTRDYANLLDYVKQLYQSHLEQHTNRPLEKVIYPENWTEEEAIQKLFGSQFTHYKGHIIYREFLEEQKLSHIVLGGQLYERIPYGQEPDFQEEPDTTGYYSSYCHDCDAIPGLFHSIGCDVEVCPKCRKQLLSCTCVDYSKHNSLGSALRAAGRATSHI